MKSGLISYRLSGSDYTVLEKPYMNYALILSGGTGTRFGGSVPKQYITVKEKPVVGYCIDTFQSVSQIDRIVIVASEKWFGVLSDYLAKNRITKFSAFAVSGKSRQHSVLNGLEAIKKLGAERDDLVVIHDAARPCVSEKIILGCLDSLTDHDMSMPVTAVKETIYYSENGQAITGLLNRDRLYAGQAPEGCRFGSYYHVNRILSDEELSSVRGTCAVGFQYGLSVKLFPGDETNFKITTQGDLSRFRQIMGVDE